MSASKIAAGLAIQKYWSANLNAQAGRAIAIYSQRLSKAIAEWGVQDTNHANTFQQASYLLAKAEGSQETYGVFSTDAFPFAVPQMKAPKPTEAEDAALSILTAVAASELHHARIFDSAARTPMARPLYQYLDLEALSQVSKAREQIAMEMKAQIGSGALWANAAPVHWRCLQCGSRHHGKSALEECPCCKAGRAFQTNGGW